jgi:hypothetical protein
VARRDGENVTTKWRVFIRTAASSVGKWKFRIEIDNNPLNVDCTTRALNWQAKIRYIASALPLVTSPDVSDPDEQKGITAELHVHLG